VAKVLKNYKIAEEKISLPIKRSELENFLINDFTIGESNVEGQPYMFVKRKEDYD